MWKILMCVFILLTFGEITKGQYCEDDDFVYVGGKCLKAFFELTASWARAAEFCEKINATLAIIDDCSVLGDLVRYLHLAGLQNVAGYWIGASDEEAEGEWLWSNGSVVSMGAPYWGQVQDGEDLVEEPSGGTNENCAQLSGSDQFYFHDERCERGANPLCQKKTLDISLENEDIEPITNVKIIEQFDIPSLCTGDFIPIGGSCFLFIEVDSWQDARSKCQSQTEYSSELAIIKDCNLFGKIVNHLKDQKDINETLEGDYYLGGSDEGEEGAWFWTDYTPMQLGTPFWASNNGAAEPSLNTALNCVAMSFDYFYYFRAIECDEPAFAICQADQQELSIY